MEDRGGVSSSSDETLVRQAREGDRGAFAVLWRRHAGSGLRVARQFTSSIDADDLVAEAYTSIYRRVLAGGGPDGAFRPYLYTTIRNLASRWGRSSRDVSVEDIDEFEDPEVADDPVTVALDRTLTARAFRSLPDRWQAVLWYTEVEGMDPHEVAPILGLTANGVAALSYRAREGLRKAWLQAHVSDTRLAGECRWVIDHLGEHARNSLSARDAERLDRHLPDCPRCSIIAEEVDEVGSRLAFVLLPLLLGGTAGGAWIATVGAPTGASAAALAAAMPPAFSVGVPAAVGGLSAVATPSLVGSLALVIAVSGGLAVGFGADQVAPLAGASHIAVTEPGLSPEQDVSLLSSDIEGPERPKSVAVPVLQNSTPRETSSPGSVAVVPLAGNVLDGAGSVVDAVGSVVGGAGSVSGGVGSVVGGAGTVVDGVLGSTTPVVVETVAPVTDLLTDIITPVTKSAGEVVAPVVSVVDNVVEPIGSGLLSDTVTEPVSGVLSEPLGVAKRLLNLF